MRVGEGGGPRSLRQTHAGRGREGTQIPTLDPCGSGRKGDIVFMILTSFSFFMFCLSWVDAAEIPVRSVWAGEVVGVIGLFLFKFVAAFGGFGICVLSFWVGAAEIHFRSVWAGEVFRGLAVFVKVFGFV